MFGFWLGLLEILDLVFVWMIGFFLVFLDCRVSQFFWLFGLSKGWLELDLKGN